MRIIIILFFLLIFLIFFVYYNKNYNYIKNNNGDYIVYNNLINDYEINELKKSRKLIKENKLGSFIFNKSKSSVFYFKDLNYFKKICEKYNLISLFNISKKIINKSPKKGNYYILNLLEISPIEDWLEKRYDPKLHYDDTILSVFEKMGKEYEFNTNMLNNYDNNFRPEIISVFYIDKNECFSGGELDIYKSHNKENRAYGEALIDSINLKENNLVYFSGKYYHGVKNYSIENCKKNIGNRLSLVIEIYDINNSRLEEMINMYEL